MFRGQNSGTEDREETETVSEKRVRLDPLWEDGNLELDTQDPSQGSKAQVPLGEAKERSGDQGELGGQYSFFVTWALCGHVI